MLKTIVKKTGKDTEDAVNINGSVKTESREHYIESPCVLRIFSIWRRLGLGIDIRGCRNVYFI